MFGAYQAGAWKALAGRFRPDVVVGASVGALNAWAIAGGASPEELVERWLEPGCRALSRFRWRQPPWRGVFDSEPLHAQVRELCGRYTPRIEVGVVATELPRLKPRLFLNREVDWRTLAASAAVPFLYRPMKIEGRWYADGGLLGPLPLWAAARMGAARILAIHVLATPPSGPAAAMVRAFRAVAPRIPRPPAGVEVEFLTPSRRLGSLHAATFWRRREVERWLRLGEEDGARLSLWQAG